MKEKRGEGSVRLGWAVAAVIAATVALALFLVLIAVGSATSQLGMWLLGFTFGAAFFVAGTLWTMQPATIRKVPS